jgi:hypothetical protein
MKQVNYVIMWKTLLAKMNKFLTSFVVLLVNNLCSECISKGKPLKIYLKNCKIKIGGLQNVLSCLQYSGT